MGIPKWMTPRGQLGFAGGGEGGWGGRDRCERFRGMGRRIRVWDEVKPKNFKGPGPSTGNRAEATRRTKSLGRGTVIGGA